MSLEFHPLANIFPLVEGAEFNELVADIRDHGLHEPIVVFEGQVLDGRNRYRACTAAGVEPTFTVYTGNDPVAYVVSLNLRRRHLSESQRAMVAAKLVTLKLGDNQHSEGLPIGRSSELLNVGERSVARAREVIDHGATELVHAVEHGAVSVSAAADVATLPEPEQQEVVARGTKEILRVAQELRARDREIRRAKRIAQIAEIAKSTSTFPNGRFPIIYADPPWKMALDEIGSTRSYEAHYPNMKTAEICALPVSDLATPDAALFLWAIPAMLTEAFEVMSAWGFNYVAQVVWVKDKIGMGFWVRYQHELLLIGRRGDIPTPPERERPPSIVNSPRREHSRKPDEAYELIERMYPELPKIELFARNARRGWSVWGNEAKENLASASTG